MPILYTEHVQSNIMLSNATETDISILGNLILFEVCFNEKEDASCVKKWYKPTKRKFFYTLCKKNLDRVWKIMEDESRKDGDEEPTGITYLFCDSWDRNRRLGTAARIVFDDITVETPKPHFVHARASMRMKFSGPETVEIVDFIPELVPKSIMKKMEKSMRTMLIDASNFGIKSGVITSLDF